LAVPKPKIRNKVNDVPVEQTIDDFKSLATMKLTGEVTDENVPLDYNGEIYTTVLTKKIPKVTYNTMTGIVRQ
jgi:hypothetical protein